MDASIGLNSKILCAIFDISYPEICFEIFPCVLNRYCWCFYVRCKQKCRWYILFPIIFAIR